MALGVIVAVSPVDWTEVSDTDPVKPFRAVTETPVVWENPWPTIIGFVAAVRLKSTTIKVNVIDLETVVLNAVTVTA